MSNPKPTFSIKSEDMESGQNVGFFGSHDRKDWTFIGWAVKDGSGFTSPSMQQSTFRYVGMWSVDKSNPPK